MTKIGLDELLNLVEEERARFLKENSPVDDSDDEPQEPTGVTRVDKQISQQKQQRERDRRIYTMFLKMFNNLRLETGIQRDEKLEDLFNAFLKIYADQTNVLD